MILWIIAIVLITVTALVITNWSAIQKTLAEAEAEEIRLKEEKEKEEIQLQNEKDARKELYESEKYKLLDLKYADFTLKRCNHDGNDAYIALSENHDQLYIITFKDLIYNYFEIISEKCLNYVDIQSADYSPVDEKAIVSVPVETPIVVAKKKSAIARGAVGAALLGPAGLVLGVASALTPTSEIKTITTMQRKEVNSRGPTYLTIFPKGLKSAPLRLRFYNVDQAKRLAFWISERLN